MVVTNAFKKQFGNRLLLIQVDFRIWANLTLPIRLQYAYDQAQYAVACDIEACEHYVEKQSAIRRVSLYISGFVNGIVRRDIPEWFVDRWFSESHSKEVSNDEAQVTNI